MSRYLRRAVLAASVGVAALWAFGAGEKSAETAIRDWPARPRATALALIEEYGEPQSVEADRLVWLDNGPWSKTVVYREAPRNFLGLRDRRILEQSITYEVPKSKVYELRNFDGRLRYDPETGLLSSREESEGRNYLALNLADDVVTERQDSTTARDFYRKTVKLAQSGKTSAYMEGFNFKPSEKARQAL